MSNNYSDEEVIALKKKFFDKNNLSAAGQAVVPWNSKNEFLNNCNGVIFVNNFY